MRYLLSGLMIMSVLLVAPLSVGAAGNASMSLSTSASSVEQGDQFDVVVRVEPNGEELDTVRAVLTYDPTILNATNVSLIGAFDRLAPGNYRDNVNGKVSWGAFTLNGPITSSTEFVTVTFTALQEGTANLAISSDSRAISNGDERINLSALDKATVTVTTAEDVEPGLALVVVSSQSHADQEAWYPQNDVELSWMELEGDSPISAYYYAFGDSVDIEPITYLSAETTELTQNDIGDGVHYFRLKGVQEDGRETAIVTYQVNSDTTAPNPIELTIQEDQIVEGESVWMTFATTDDASGVLQYQVAINDSAFQVQTSPLEMTDLAAGTYFFRVAALDRAGNAMYDGKSVRVYPEGTVLERPEEYEKTSEIEAITQTIGEKLGIGEARTGLVIIVLVIIVIVLIALGAIIRKKKRPN